MVGGGSGDEGDSGAESARVSQSLRVTVVVTMRQCSCRSNDLWAGALV